MFVINEDKSIYVTRGDVAFFSLSVKTEEGETYKFQPGDVIRMKVFEKKACDNVVLTKDFGIEEETEEIEILLEEKDTKIGKIINKPVDYWYEVELNPYTDPQTIIGYDEDGAKIFRLYPEGNDVTEEPIEPEEIPVVDEELSLTSTRPVQNQAIARAIANIRQEVDIVLDRQNEEVSAELARLDSFIKGEGIAAYEEYDLSPYGSDIFHGRIYTNGIFATYQISVSSTVSYYLSAHKSSEVISKIPIRYVPFTEGEDAAYVETDMPGVMLFFGITDQYLDGEKLVNIFIKNHTDESLQIDGLVGWYMLDKPCIPEITDARFGIDGKDYGTLGTVIRSLEKRIKTLEQK